MSTRERYTPQIYTKLFFATPSEQTWIVMMTPCTMSDMNRKKRTAHQELQTMPFCYIRIDIDEVAHSELHFWSRVMTY